MISVAFTFSPAGGATDLEVEGRAFDGWASARYDDSPSEISEGGPHLVVELPVERFSPDGRGLVLWIGDDCFRVDRGTRRAPAGGTVTGEGPRVTGTLPVMVVVRAGEREFAGMLVPPDEDPAAGWDE